MELIEKILSEENLQKAIRKVKKNKGAAQPVAFFFMMFLRYRAFFFSLASCHLCGIPFFEPHCKKSHQDWN